MFARQNLQLLVTWNKIANCRIAGTIGITCSKFWKIHLTC